MSPAQGLNSLRLGPEGRRLRFLLAGPEGAEVLMLGHALGTDHRMWQPQVASLSRRFRLVVPDFPGHGGSEAPDAPCTFDALAGVCAALADVLGVARLNYAGVSLGGVVGMRLALARPGLVARLVLSNTRCEVDQAFAAACAARIAAVRDGGMAALAGPTVARWFPEGFLERRPELAALLAEMFMQTAPRAYADLCRDLGGLAICDSLAALDLPALVIGGSLDRTTPPQVVARLSGAIRSAGLRVFEGVAHFPNMEVPDLFDDALRAFLERPLA